MTVAEFIYSVLLRPRLLRRVTDRLLRAIVPQSVELHGVRIVMNPDDPVVSGAITLGVYEKPETRFFLSVCRQGMIYVDIGANIGYYTALGALRVGPSGRVVAIEPDPECYGYLVQTVGANHFCNVSTVQKAVSGSLGAATLYRNLSNRGDNRLYPNELSQNQIIVETTTVDKLLPELGIASVDLIKMDIQGFEGHAFSGMGNTLAQERPLIILTEFWPKGLAAANTQPHEVLGKLVLNGFRLYELTSTGKLKSFEDLQALINRYPGRQYTNIVATKGIEAREIVPV